MILARRQAVPVGCDRCILLDGAACCVHHAEVVLPFRVALLGRFAIPDHSQRIIAWHAKQSIGIETAKTGLRFGIALLRHSAQDFYRSTAVAARERLF